MKKIRQNKIKEVLREAGNYAPKIDIKAIIDKQPKNISICSVNNKPLSKNQKKQKVKIIFNKKQEESVSSAKGKIKFKPIFALAVALCLIVATVFPLSVSLINSLNTLLYIDAADTVVLSVDYTGKVKAAAIVDNIQNGQLNALTGAKTCAANADDNIQKTFPNLKNKKVEEAVASAVDYLNKKGSLDDGVELIISTVCKNSGYAKKIADRAKRGAEQKVSFDTVIVVAGNTKKTEQNMSPAKQKYLNEALTLDTGYTKEQLKSFSAGFLRKLCGYTGNSDDKDKENKDNNGKGNNNGENGNGGENNGNNGDDKGDNGNNGNGGEKGNGDNNGKGNKDGN